MIDYTVQKPKHNLLLLTISLCLVMSPLIAAAEDPLVGTAQTMNPRALGTAGAMIASPGGTNGVYLNPATIVMAPLYHIEGMYQFTSRENMHNGGLVIVDSVTLPNIGAGVSFNYAGCDSNRTEHDSFDGRLSLAGAIGKMFSLGVTGRYLSLEQNRSSSNWGPAGRPALPASGSRQVNGFTVDAAAALRIAEIVTLGLVGYNLTHVESVFAPIVLGSGISLNLMKILSLETDVLADFTSHDKTGLTLRAGGEIFLADTVFIRAGYQHDFYYQRNLIAAGAGYQNPNFGIDLGFSQDIVGEGKTRVGISFKYFVP